MFRFPLAAMTLATVSLGSMAYVPPPQAIEADEVGVAPVQQRRRKRAFAPTPAVGSRRSRGPQAKPKRRRNMLVVGRRARRKHRRAA
jgi:hypothetical protein